MGSSCALKGCWRLGLSACLDDPILLLHTAEGFTPHPIGWTPPLYRGPQLLAAKVLAQGQALGPGSPAPVLLGWTLGHTAHSPWGHNQPLWGLPRPTAPERGLQSALPACSGPCLSGVRLHPSPRPLNLPVCPGRPPLPLQLQKVGGDSDLSQQLREKDVTALFQHKGVQKGPESVSCGQQGPLPRTEAATPLLGPGDPAALPHMEPPAGGGAGATPAAGRDTRDWKGSLGPHVVPPPDTKLLLTHSANIAAPSPAGPGRRRELARGMAFQAGTQEDQQALRAPKKLEQQTAPCPTRRLPDWVLQMHSVFRKQVDPTENAKKKKRARMFS